MEKEPQSAEIRGCHMEASVVTAFPQHIQVLLSRTSCKDESAKEVPESARRRGTKTLAVTQDLG